MRAVCLLACAGVLLSQDLVLAPKPAQLPKYVAPHKPHTKIADVKARHERESNWNEVVVDDNHLHAAYVFSAAGAHVARRFHPDTREWWIVLEGQIRFEIEGLAPFVASKGWMVQAPMQTIYSMETVGAKPSLRFEVNVAHAKTLYPRDAKPPSIAGFDWTTVKIKRTPGVYARANKPYVTFEELAKNREQRKAPMTQRVVEDDRGTANFIYGYEKELPPINPKDRGHYHPECAEFWLILSGQIRYAIEGQGVLIANEGDVVYVPAFTFHAPRFYGAGPSCRLAMNGYPNIAHLFDSGVD